MQQAAGDVEPLPHTPGEALDPFVLATPEADELEQLVDADALPLGADAVELAEVAQVVAGVEPVVEAAVAAEDVADVAPDLARLRDDVVTEDAGVP